VRKAANGASERRQRSEVAASTYKKITRHTKPEDSATKKRSAECGRWECAEWGGCSPRGRSRKAGWHGRAQQEAKRTENGICLGRRVGEHTNSPLGASIPSAGIGQKTWGTKAPGIKSIKAKSRKRYTEECVWGGEEAEKCEKAISSVAKKGVVVTPGQNAAVGSQGVKASVGAERRWRGTQQTARVDVPQGPVPAGPGATGAASDEPPTVATPRERGERGAAGQQVHTNVGVAGREAPSRLRRAIGRP